MNTNAFGEAISEGLTVFAGDVLEKHVLMLFVQSELLDELLLVACLELDNLDIFQGRLLLRQLAELATLGDDRLDQSRFGIF